MTAATAPSLDAGPPRILVAVHGIGDQFNYETVQSVVHRLAVYYNDPIRIPLGSFHDVGGSNSARVFMAPPSAQFRAGFAEVYWADIPREVNRRGYELEESKKWASTIVARMQSQATTGLGQRDYQLIETVLREMIETISVLERLCFIAEKAGVFRFNLQRILQDFINDVQLVTEFSTYRRAILKKFDTVFASAAEMGGDPEIYIVAHSEGTVVTLAGLLVAMGQQPPPAWLGRVRGIMTIGSPLDAHILLWPELWQRAVPSVPWKPPAAIPWHNYLDHGDPIADRLDMTQAWLEANNCRGVFSIENHAFSRYYFPGKAHVDYWNDEHVFGHFIEEMLGPPPGAAGPSANRGPSGSPTASRAPSETPRRFPDTPKTRWLPRVTSYVAPYGIIGLLLFVAMFALYRTIADAIRSPEGPAIPALTVLRDVGALAFLLGGITVAARIPRLTTLWRWRIAGLAIFLLSAVAYPWIATATFHGMMDQAFERLDVPPAGRRLGVLLGATIIVLAVSFLGRRFARFGVRPLLIAGGIVVVVIIGSLVAGKAHDAQPVWPVILGAVAFFYLWWVAMLLFDLVFVWHRYIRHSVAIKDLQLLTGPPAGGTPGARTG